MDVVLRVLQFLRHEGGQGMKLSNRPYGVMRIDSCDPDQTLPPCAASGNKAAACDFTDDSVFKDLFPSLKARLAKPYALMMVAFLLKQGANVNQRCYGAFFCPDDQKDGRADSLEHEYVELGVETNYTGYA